MFSIFDIFNLDSTCGKAKRILGIPYLFIKYYLGKRADTHLKEENNSVAPTLIMH